jgi:hypothetical protein
VTQGLGHNLVVVLSLVSIVCFFGYSYALYCKNIGNAMIALGMGAILVTTICILTGTMVNVLSILSITLENTLALGAIMLMIGIAWFLLSKVKNMRQAHSQPF